MSNYYNSETLIEQQAEIEKLKSERDALAAQVEALKSRVGTAERVEAIFSEAPELSFVECKKLFPEEIRELRAEAGRAGFVAGYLLCNDGSTLIKHNYEGFADKYAEQILRSDV